MEAPLSEYDLAIAWSWTYDEEFVHLIEEASRTASLKALCIDRESVDTVYDQLRKQSLRFRFFLDRASDENEAFHPIARLIKKRAVEPDGGSVTRRINPDELLARAADKATMHLEFLSNGINVPYTIIISPFNHRKEVELSLSELAKLGRPFIIKPANTTGGGIGVVTGAESLKDVIAARQHHRNDKYLLQETITPALLDHHRAWFRVFYAFGGILPCWWDDQTHVYKEISEPDERALGLEELRRITAVIHTVCGLEFFSTELVLTSEGKFVAVDYVNEMCDMRMRRSHVDGVPDNTVQEIVRLLVRFVASDGKADPGSPSYSISS
jgi:hypothetical protein